MPTTADDIRQSLLAQDPEYRRLAEEHLRCEMQLQQIHEERYLNAEDLALEVTLKKTKVHLRDLMELMVSRQKHAMAAH